VVLALKNGWQGCNFSSVKNQSVDVDKDIDEVRRVIPLVDVRKVSGHI